MLPLPCMLVCSFVCANRTRDRGCSKHPVFPAPSDKEGGKRYLANLGRNAPRDRETISTVIASVAKQSIFPTLRHRLLRSARNDVERTSPRDYRLIFSCHHPRRRTIQYSRDAND